MTTHKEALKLALEALKYHTEQTRPIENTNKVIAVIEKELDYSECNCNQGQVCHICDPIHPALAQPEQEPAKYKFSIGCRACGHLESYDMEVNGLTTPPQRKPLREEMRKQMKESCDSSEMRGAFADGWISAEAAHGIKE